MKRNSIHHDSEWIFHYFSQILRINEKRDVSFYDKVFLVAITKLLKLITMFPKILICEINLCGSVTLASSYKVTLKNAP